VGADRRQGAVGEHRWGPRVAPCKKSGGEAHQGGRATVGRWEAVAGAASERDKKHGTRGGGNPAGGARQRPFKGGRRDARGGGVRGVGRHVGRSGGEREGARALRQQCSGVASGGSGPAAARAGGGTHTTRTRVTDQRARASVGPGGQRRGAGVSMSERVSAVLTSGAGSTLRPIRFSNRINFISNGFKFALNFD
jgi:hypothetical protein